LEWLSFGGGKKQESAVNRRRRGWEHEIGVEPLIFYESTWLLAGG